MSLFAVELPVRDDVHRGKFVAQIVTWLKGMKGSTLFDEGVVLKGDGEANII